MRTKLKDKMVILIKWAQTLYSSEELPGQKGYVVLTFQKVWTILHFRIPFSVYFLLSIAKLCIVFLQYLEAVFQQWKLLKCAMEVLEQVQIVLLQLQLVLQVFQKFRVSMEISLMRSLPQIINLHRPIERSQKILKILSASSLYRQKRQIT